MQLLQIPEGQTRKKHLLPVHKVQEQPLYHQEAHSHSNCIVRVAQHLAYPFKKGIIQMVPFYKAAGNIDHDRVDANDLEEKRPAAVALHVYDIVKTWPVTTG